jgi:uncharacterized protein YbjQ (UPF0145 family)
MAEHTAPANWYADPGKRYAYRYFDGSRWTEHVSDNLGNRLDDPLPDLAGAPGPDPASVAPTAVPEVPLLTIPHVPGRDITEVRGLVTSCAVMSRNVFSDLGSDLASLGGGNLSGIERAIAIATQQARQRLYVQAYVAGADTVVGVQVGLETVADKAQAVVMSGTAVRTAEPA